VAEASGDLFVAHSYTGKRSVRPGTLLPESRITSAEDAFLARYVGLFTKEASTSGTLLKVKLCQETIREIMTNKDKEKATRWCKKKKQALCLSLSLLSQPSDYT
jgi:hypothetical protein